MAKILSDEPGPKKEAQFAPMGNQQVERKGNSSSLDSSVMQPRYSFSKKYILCKFSSITSEFLIIWRP